MQDIVRQVGRRPKRDASRARHRAQQHNGKVSTFLGTGAVTLGFCAAALAGGVGVAHATDGSPDGSTSSKDTTDSASSSQGTTGSASSSQGTTGSASSSQGTTGSASSSQGTTGSASSSQGTTGSASSSQGATGSDKRNHRRDRF